VMLGIDLLLLRHALAPLQRLAALMGNVDLLHPGLRATGFERSSGEVLALAEAFNRMLERLETERRASAQHVLAGQEAERLRLARELHDELGQTLTAVALRAEHAAARAGLNSEELSQLAAIVLQSLEDVRRISRELRPEALDDLGLVNALIALCSRVSRQTHVTIERQLEGHLPRLSATTELVVYRIAQEALTNAVRHSSATAIRVSLVRCDEDVVLVVSDNGRGLADPVNEGSGLVGMRERAMLAGAELEIGSDGGGGVEVTLRVASEDPGG